MKSVSSSPLINSSVRPNVNSLSDTDAPELLDQSIADLEGNGSFSKLSQHTIFVQTGSTYSDTMTLNIHLPYDLAPHDERIAVAQAFFDQIAHFRTQNKEHISFTKVLLEMEEVFRHPFNDYMERYRRIMNMLEYYKVADIQTSAKSRFIRDVCGEELCFNVNNMSALYVQHAMDKVHIDTNFQFYYGSESPDVIKSRHKRVAPLLLIGAAAVYGAVISTISGIYSAVEIARIWKGLESLQKSHNSLVLHVQEIINNTQNLGEQVKDLNSFHQLAIEKNPAVTGIKFGVKLKAVEEDVLFLEHLFSDLQKGRLYEGFFRKNMANLTLSTLMQSAIAKAAVTGYRPIVNHEIEYLALDVSHVILNHQIVIIMHIPCVRVESEMTIYKLLPFPYPLSLNFDKEFFGSNHETGLYIETEDQLIAVNKDNSRFKLFTQSYLQTCFHRNTLYVCENNNRVLKNFDNHCVSALYDANVKAIHNQCKFRRRPLVEHVVQIGNENFLIFSPISTDAPVSCANSHSTYTVSIESYEIKNLTLPPGCFITLPESDQYSAENVKLTYYTMRSFHSSDLLDFPANLVEDNTRFHNMLAKFTRDNDKFVKQSEKLRKSVALDINTHDMTASSFSLSSLFPGIPSGVIGACVGAFVIFVIFLLMKLSKKSKKSIEQKKSESKVFVNTVLAQPPFDQPAANPYYPPKNHTMYPSIDDSM